MTTTVRVLYFGALRDALGAAGETVELTAAAPSAQTLRDFLRARGGKWSEALAADRALACAVDQDFAPWERPLADGVEVALFPPVTGG